MTVFTNPTNLPSSVGSQGAMNQTAENTNNKGIFSIFSRFLNWITSCFSRTPKNLDGARVTVTAVPEVLRLQKKCALLLKTIGEWRAQTEKLTQANENLLDTVKRLTAQEEELTQENDNLQTQAETNQYLFDKKITNLTSEMTNLRKASDTEIKGLESEISILRREISTLTSQRDQTLKVLTSDSKERGDLNTKIQGLEDQLKTVRNELAQLESQREQIASELTPIPAELDIPTAQPEEESEDVFYDALEGDVHGFINLNDYAAPNDFDKTFDSISSKVVTGLKVAPSVIFQAATSALSDFVIGGSAGLAIGLIAASYSYPEEMAEYAHKVYSYVSDPLSAGSRLFANNSTDEVENIFFGDIVSLGEEKVLEGYKSASSVVTNLWSAFTNNSEIKKSIPGLRFIKTMNETK